MKNKCICEICNCGRHRCPHKPNGVINKTNEPCVYSEYKDTYFAKPMEKTQSFKPSLAPVKSDAPCEDATTHKLDYIEHPLNQRYVHKQDIYKPPHGDIDDMTSYKKEYIAKRVTPAKAVRHEPAREQLANFQGNPTYLNDYKAWDIQRRTPCMPDSSWMPPSEKFASQTTARQDFLGYSQPPRESMRPVETNRASSQPFDDETGYKRNYIAHELPKKFKRADVQFRPPSQRMDDLTTQKKDFCGKRGDKSESFKPAGKAFASDAPFDENTTQKTDYQKWDTKPRSAIYKEPYQRPLGDMDTTTSYNQNYKPLPMERVFGRRPPSATKVNSGRFDDDTTNKLDYKHWHTERTRPKAKEEFKPMSAPFEGLSTQKAHYIQHPTQTMKSFKPDGTVIKSDSPFYDDTNYRTTYTPKIVEVCPASLLQTNRSNYQFVRATSRGHQEYQSITPLGLSNGNRTEAITYA